MKEKERNDRIKFCIKEYFMQDEKILLDVTMLELKTLGDLLRNNTFLGNQIYIGKEMIEDREEKHIEEYHGIVRENVEILKNRIRKEPEKYILLPISLEKEKNIIDYLCDHMEVILYTKLERRKEKIESMDLRARSYRGNVCFEWKFVQSVGFCNVPEIYEEEEKLFIRRVPEIAVYDSNFTRIFFKRIRLRIGNYVVRMEKIGDDRVWYRIYKVVNYHSRSNLIEITSKVILKGEKKPDLQSIPESFQKMILENLC